MYNGLVGPHSCATSIDSTESRNCRSPKAQGSKEKPKAVVMYSNTKGGVKRVNSNLINHHINKDEAEK